MNNRNSEVIYVGDPMCSWCWAICPALKKLQAYCAEQNIPFRIIVGGLRNGGADMWNDNFKNFLRSNWQNITKVSNQPFGYKLLDKKEFDYNTEPACRAVVSARELLKDSDKNSEILYAFFAEIQRKFYVESEDPKQHEFYRDLCKNININFDEFIADFESQDIKAETKADFELSRSWGVNSYPSILFQTNNTRSVVVSGFVEPQEMIDIIEQMLK